MEKLASYLQERLPEGLKYPEAAQLCLHLYCTVEGVPKQFLPLSKEVLGDAFAELARMGWVREEGRMFSVSYGANFHQVTDRGHWVEVIASIFKKGNVVDDVKGAELAQRVGFTKCITT